VDELSASTPAAGTETFTKPSGSITFLCKAAFQEHLNSVVE
jgi:hypothetical protein